MCVFMCVVRREDFTMDGRLGDESTSRTNPPTCLDVDATSVGELRRLGHDGVCNSCRFRFASYNHDRDIWPIPVPILEVRVK